MMSSIGVLRAVVFADIDGTMTAPGVPWEWTRETLRACEVHGVGVVPVTSKTMAEMAAWCRQPAVLPVFVYESGWGIALETTWAHLLATDLEGRGYRPTDALDGWDLYEWPVRPGVDELRRLAASVGVEVRPLSEVPVEVFARWSGLSPAAAEAAYRRRGPMPFIIEAGSPRALAREARKWGLYLLRGRLLWTLTPVHKGRAVAAVYPGLRRIWPGAAFWAIGDSPSDRRMGRRGVPFVRVRDPEAWRRWVRGLWEAGAMDPASGTARRNRHG